VVNLDDIIEYTANLQTLVGRNTTGDNGGTTGGNDTFLAHMAGHSVSGTTTPGDIL
jgi:hypothetical protein